MLLVKFNLNYYFLFLFYFLSIFYVWGYSQLLSCDLKHQKLMFCFLLMFKSSSRTVWFQNIVCQLVVFYL